MSSILCPQPSTDSYHVVEATTMRLKLVSPHKPINDYFNTEKSLDVHNQIYFKRSQKSLELCTESLGSETGSDTSEDDTIFSFPASSSSVKRSLRNQVVTKKVLSRSFPPPLTSMSGSKTIQVRPHREGGRLIIDAMETALGNSCLRAERSHGRLRLTCWKREESHENDMKDLEKDEVVENFQRLRRCNEDEKWR